MQSVLLWLCDGDVGEHGRGLNQFAWRGGDHELFFGRVLGGV